MSDLCNLVEKAQFPQFPECLTVTDEASELHGRGQIENWKVHCGAYETILCERSLTQKRAHWNIHSSNKSTFETRHEHTRFDI